MSARTIIVLTSVAKKLEKPVAAHFSTSDHTLEDLQVVVFGISKRNGSYT